MDDLLGSIEDAPLPDELPPQAAEGDADENGDAELDQEDTDAEDTDGEGEDGDTDGEAAGDDDEDADAETGEDAPPRKRSRYQRLKARLAEVNSKLAELEARTAGGRAAAGQDGEPEAEKPDTKEAPKKEEPPKEEDFDGDYFAFTEAMTAYRAREAAREVLREEQDKKADTARKEAADAAIKAHLDRVKEAKKTIADFDQVVAKAKGVKISDAAVEEIMASDKSALLIYHLAQNPKEIAALNQMSPREVARRIGQMEGDPKMALPQGKTKTAAPKPPRQVNGGATTRVDPSKMSMADYQKWRSGGGGR